MPPRMIEVRRYPAALSPGELRWLRSFARRCDCARLAIWLDDLANAEEARRDADPPIEASLPLIDVCEWTEGELDRALTDMTLREPSVVRWSERHGSNLHKFYEGLRLVIVAACGVRLRQLAAPAP
jgi:hypothetical protein